MTNNRISTSYQYTAYSSQIQAALQRMSVLQNQVSTGHKFDNMRDDPIGAATVLSAHSLQSRYAQFDANLRIAKEYLGASDQAMGDVNDLVNNGSSLALQGANAATDTATRASLAQQAAELQKRLVLIANTQGTDDKYMFAGQALKTKPFSAANGTLTTVGDDNPILVETRPGEKMQVNLVNGSQVFTDTYNKLETLRKNLTSGDASALQTSISDFKKSSTDIIGLRGDAGTKMQTVNKLSEDNLRRIDDLTKQASDAQDVDLAETLTKYQSAQLGYQASLQVIASANKFSLLDFLR